jgi:hypothetical protein
MDGSGGGAKREGVEAECSESSSVWPFIHISAINNTIEATYTSIIDGE